MDAEITSAAGAVQILYLCVFVQCDLRDDALPVFGGELRVKFIGIAGLDFKGLDTLVIPFGECQILRRQAFKIP